MCTRPGQVGGHASGAGSVGTVRGVGHPGEDQGERDAQLAGQCPVGGGAVPHHHGEVGRPGLDGVGVGRCGLPATSGVVSAAVATAANRAPQPGESPWGVGWVGSSLVPIRRAPAAHGPGGLSR